MKRNPSTTPSRLESASKQAFPEGKLVTPAKRDDIAAALAQTRDANPKGACCYNR